MCISVIIDGVSCETRRQLRAAFSTDLIFLDGGSYDEGKEDYCLCSVDLIRTADLAGFELSWNDDGDIVFTKKPDENHGYCEGEDCGRKGCDGILREHSSDIGCSCHISAPCASCTTDRTYCPECDWSAQDDA